MIYGLRGVNQNQMDMKMKWKLAFCVGLWACRVWGSGDWGPGTQRRRARGAGVGV